MNSPIDKRDLLIGGRGRSLSGLSESPLAIGNGRAPSNVKRAPQGRERPQSSGTSASELGPPMMHTAPRFQALG